MSPLRAQDHIDALAAEIVSLKEEMVQARREAGDLHGDEVACQLAQATADVVKETLSLRLWQYFEAVEEDRRQKCPIHGPKTCIVTCPDCVEAWGWKAAS
jgi:hypothetical protein